DRPGARALALRAVLLAETDRAVRPVPAVAGLRQRVGGEGGEGLGRHQLVDDRLEARLVDEVEVVHGLGSLVAEVAEALEPRRSGHSLLLVGGGASVRRPSQTEE